MGKFTRLFYAVLLLSFLPTLIFASMVNDDDSQPNTLREVVFTGTIFGYLDDQQDEFFALPGVHVEVLVNGGNTFYADTWSDEAGHFSFDADYPDSNWPFFHEADAVVTADGYYQQEITLDFSAWPIYMNFYLLPLQTENDYLSGYVYTQSDPDGELIPVSGVLLEIFDNELLADFTTAESGYYEFGFIAYDANLIVVSAEGYLIQEAPLPGYSEEPIVLDFILQPEPDPSDFGQISGEVTTSLSLNGIVYPLEGAVIHAAQLEGEQLWYETSTNEIGQYELDLPVSEIPWQVTCNSIIGNQSMEVIIEASTEIVLDFHLNAWEYPPLSPPVNLITALSEDESVVWLNWEPPVEWPLFCNPQYTVSANNMVDSDHDWYVLGETSDLEWQDFPEPFNGEELDMCYRVTAFCEEINSASGNISCIQSWEVQFPPPPNGLSAVYNLEPDPAGSVMLDWYYPIIPEPELQPIFQVYAHLGELSENEYIYIGGTTELHFEYQFDGFDEPAPVNCFRINAQVGEELSEYSNTVCINLEDEEPGEFQLFGNVYIVGETQEMIVGAGIQAFDVMSGDEYETITDESGHYELIVEPGEYIITGTYANEILQQHQLILENTWGLQIDFWSGEFPESHLLNGMVYGRAANGELVPVSDTELMLVQEGIYMYSTSNAGAYEIDLPWDGYWTVSIHASDFMDLNQDIWFDDSGEINFTLTPLGDLYPTWLRAGSNTGIPGANVDIELIIENPESVSDIGFTLSETPQWLTTIELISNLECFTTVVDDDGTGVNVWLYGVEDCILEPGINQFATLVFQISESAEFGQNIIISFEDVSILDAYGNDLYIFTENSIIILELLGDVNQDGETNVLDIVQLVSFILLSTEPDEYQLWAADMNGDEMLDVLDIVLLVDDIISE